MERGIAGVVRLDPAGVAVSGPLPGQPCRDRQPPGGVAGGRGGGKEGIRGVAAPRPPGGRGGLLRGGGDSAPHGRPRGGGEAVQPRARARLQAARVEVEITSGDLDAARPAVEVLEAIAREYATPVLSAAVDTANGRLRLAEGDAPAALECLRRACVTWQELRLPYETARTRMQYGLAIRATGDEEDARLELRAARAAFERLGAVPEAAAAAELLGERGGLPGGLTAREAEVLRLGAAGGTKRGIASILVISEHTVARHLPNMFAKLGVSSRSAATAFAFEHGLA